MIDGGAFYWLDIEDISKIKSFNDGFIVFYKNGHTLRIDIDKVGTEWLKNPEFKTGELRTLTPSAAARLQVLKLASSKTNSIRSPESLKKTIISGAILIEGTGSTTVIFPSDVSSIFIDCSEGVDPCEIVVVHKSTRDETRCEINLEDVEIYNQKIRTAMLPNKIDLD